MREINFRAWDGSKIIYKLLIDTTDQEYKWLDGSLTGSEYGAWKEGGLMQYTGLKVKDVEMYESDIVYIDGLGNCIVEFGAYGWEFSGWAYQEIVRDIKKVVGNIYENPELLTQEKQDERT